MTEMSTAGDASTAGTTAGGPAAPGGKADPVVPDTVVYVCSLVIVVMVVGGVIALSMLMKQRLEVNQNVTTGAPAPGAPPKRLVSVEDSEANEFKILNDDDPFHYRVAKARGGYRRKIPFYEAAHSKQKAKKHKKTTVRVPNRKKPIKKAKGPPPKPRKAPPKKKTTRKPAARRAAAPTRPKPARATPKKGRVKGHVAQHRELTTAAPAAAVKESGISDVGVEGMEIQANKPAAAVNKGGNHTKNDTSKKNSVIHVAAKKLSAKEKKQKSIAETMKLLLGKTSNLMNAPDKINLSDVSDFIASDNNSVSELASKDAEAANENTTGTLSKSADLVAHNAGANNKVPEIVIQVKHLNKSAPVAPRGHSGNASLPGVSQGSAPDGANAPSIASDSATKGSQHKAAEDAASPLNQPHAKGNKSAGELSHAAEHPAGSSVAKGASSNVSSKESPKGDAPSPSGGSENTSIDKDSPPNAVPVDESNNRQSPDLKGPQAGEHSFKKSPADQPVDKASNPLAASGASAPASIETHPSDTSVDPSASNKAPGGVLSPAGEVPPGASAAKTSSANEKAEKAPDTNTAAAGGASAGAPADNSPTAEAVPADESALNKAVDKQPAASDFPTGKADIEKPLKVETGDKAPAANVPPAKGAPASASADNAPPANIGTNDLPDGRSPVHEVPGGRSAADNPPAGKVGNEAPAANLPPASGASASASAGSAPAAKDVPVDANRVPEGRSPVSEMPAGRSAASESPVGESGDKAPAANLPPASGASAGASAGSPPAAGEFPAGANVLPDGGSPVDGVPAGGSAEGRSPAGNVDDKAPAAHPAPGSGASAGASASDASLSNLGQSAEKESARTNKGANGAPAPVAPGGAAAAAAGGASTQRPLFCEVRKFITRPLASYCTHLLLGRLPLVTVNGAVTVGDFDSSTEEQLRLLTKARPSWPHVGLLTSLGGGGERDDAVLARAFEAGEAALDALATDAARLVRSRGLDGLNVHWAVPDLEGDVDSQALGLVTFLKKLRKELGSSAIITVVLPSEREERNAAFNVKAIQPLANYLFLSTHKNFNPYSALTRFNGPAQDTETGGMFTAIADVIREIGSSNSRQLCFTFGLSGVSYKVDEGSALAKYVPLVGAGRDQASGMSAQDAARQAAQLPKEGRAVTYDEVCKLNLTCHRAYVEKSCYDKVGDTWYGYVDEEAVASKAKWLLKDGWENLCVVAWNVDSDDVKGTCRSNAAAPYPLLRTLSQATAELSY